MFIDDLATLLVAGGAGTIGEGGNIIRSSKASIPLLPGQHIINLTETGGSGTIGVHNSDVDNYHLPGAQVVVRAETYQIMQAGLLLAWNALVTEKGRRVNFTVGSGPTAVWYVSLTAVQEPYDLGLDDKQRLRYAFNVDAVKRRSS